MVSKKSFLILVGLSIVIILGLGLYYISTQQEIVGLLKGGTNLVKEKEEISVVPPTGNVDDTADALLKELDDENLATKDLEGDLNLIDSDSQEVDDFGQSINENEF
jgi:hypothetical protein